MGGCQETLRTEANERLPEELAELEGGRDAFEAAIVRAVYAVFRNGITPPEAVSTAYGFDAVRPPLYEKSVMQPVKQEPLQNWVRLLLTETLEPLTFHRKQSQFEIPQFVGLFAASALYDCGGSESKNFSESGQEAIAALQALAAAL